jgi:Icc-related predicted phosphoesterase
VAVSDYRVGDIDLLIAEISKIQPPPDLILYGGDDIERFHQSPRNNAFERIASYARYGLCAVVGNDELPAVGKLLSGKSVFNVHSAPAKLGNYAVLGVEGAPYRSDLEAFGYCRSEREIEAHLRRQRRSVGRADLIILSHAPPEGVLDRAVRFSSDKKPRSIGSRALRKFLKAHASVALVVCGHAHLCGGMHKRTRGTTVVNAANHDDDAAASRFAVIDLGPRTQPKVEWREIRSVSLVPGIGDTSSDRLRAVGIRTVEELAAAPAELVRETISGLGYPPQVVHARARAIVEGRPILLRRPEFPARPRVFLDIETDFRQTYIWLIGLCVGDGGEYHGFFAESPGDEKAILLDFLRFMEGHPETDILTCSGSRFDERTMQSRLSSYGLPTALCDRMIDLGPAIRWAVALPIQSYGVKEIGRFWGYRYKHPDLDGFKVASLYQASYQGTKHSRSRRELGRKLREYNEDDVRCMPFMLAAIERLSKSEASTEAANTPAG